MRTGRLGEHDPRVWLEQFRDTGADQRIVIGRFDAQPLEHAVAEVARRPVNAVGDKDMVAGARGGEQGGGDGRKSRREQCDAGAGLAIELAQRIFQCFRGGRAASPITVARAVGHLIFRGGIEQGGGMVDGRVDEAVIGLWIAAGRDQPGRRLDRGFDFFRHAPLDR